MPFFFKQTGCGDLNLVARRPESPVFDTDLAKRENGIMLSKFVLRDGSKTPHKSTGDKRGNLPPEGVIIKL